MRFKRKLYTRGSSYETTIPKPLLFALDTQKKHDVVFVFDTELNKWVVEFEEREEQTIQGKHKEQIKSVQGGGR